MGRWIELEFQTGRARYTYWPDPDNLAPGDSTLVIGCDTLIRWDWMHGNRWREEKAKFFAKYPGVEVRTRSGKKIDTERDQVLE